MLKLLSKQSPKTPKTPLGHTQTTSFNAIPVTNIYISITISLQSQNKHIKYGMLRLRPFQDDSSRLENVLIIKYNLHVVVLNCSYNNKHM